MAVAGIICEYDPFHLGHLRQLDLLRAKLGPDTAVVAAMSGHFVQRGMPAAWDKFVRAEAAVAAGVDLVLELPLTGVLSSAEGFARAGVRLLDSLGLVDVLCFGAECGDAGALMELAGRMETGAFRAALRQALDRGLSYAAARQHAAEDAAGLLSRPNNILGLEYCRALRALGSAMTPLAVARESDYHALTPDPAQPSATSLRAMLPGGGWQPYVPPAVARVLSPAPLYDLSYGERAVLARLRGMSDAQWQRCAHGSEGLWSKAWRASGQAATVAEWIGLVKSKRYPQTRIQRLLLCAYLGITQADLTRPVPYGRILACNDRGRRLLRQAKQTGSLPLVNAGAVPPDRDYFQLECRAADLFALLVEPNRLPCCGSERVTPDQLKKKKK